MSILLILTVLAVLIATLLLSPSSTPSAPLTTPTQAPETAIIFTATTSSSTVVQSDELNISKPSKPCVISGCSAQLCGEEEMATTCEYREVYQCYRSARCERDTTGRCGWVEDTALRSCIDTYQ